MNKGNEKYRERVPCNFCGNKSYDIVWNNATSWLSNGVFRIVKCRKCKLVYLSPRPSQRIISKYYDPNSYWGLDISDFETKADYSERDKAYGFLYKDILNRKQSGKILDIGAGTGLFLTKFKEKGWKVRGVELSEEACQYAKKVNQIYLEKGDLLNQRYPKKSFDIVTLNGCLEHLHHPKETLAKINKVLKNKGLLVITVPNFDSIGRRLFGKKWYALQPPTHLYYFSPKTLSKMLIKSGFKDIDVKHSYWRQNYYIIFESIRMLFSPKFKKSPKGGLIDKAAPKRKSKPSFLLESGKFFAKASATLIAILEPLLKKGEVITVYAKKD